MMFFLARALSENSELRQIYIVDPGADAIVQRLRRREGRAGSHFLGFLTVVPEEWQGVRLSLETGQWSVSSIGKA